MMLLQTRFLNMCSVDISVYHYFISDKAWHNCAQGPNFTLSEIIVVSLVYLICEVEIISSLGYLDLLRGQVHLLVL